MAAVARALGSPHGAEGWGRRGGASHLWEERGCSWRPPPPPTRPPLDDAGAGGGTEGGQNGGGRLRGEGASCWGFPPGAGAGGRPSADPAKGCAEMRSGGGVGAQPRSHRRLPSRPAAPATVPPSPSPRPHPSEQGRGAGVGGRVGCPAGGARGGVPARGFSPVRSGASFGFGPGPGILAKPWWAGRAALRRVEPGSHPCSEPRISGWSAEGSDCRPFGK